MVTRVMVIDDSEADLLYARIVLERSLPAVDVVAFEDAREALAALAAGSAGPVAVILLDINMPGMNGFEFLAALASAVPEPAPVVVMLTSSPDPEDRRRALAYPGVRGYVTKPLDAQGLQTIAAFLPARGA